MKNLKIKLGLFSFLAILAVSAFLSSCEQTDLKIDDEFVQEDIVFMTMDEFVEMFGDENVPQLNETESIEFVNQNNSSINDRGCGVWRNYMSCWWHHNYSPCIDRDLKFKARWCGPPNNGAWEVIIMSCGTYCN